MADGEQRIADKIKESLDRMDADTHVEVPDINSLRRMVAEVNRQKRIRDTQETLMFLGCAVIILGAQAYGFQKSEFAFIVTQILTLVVLAGSVLFKSFRWKLGGKMHE